jgi:OmpR family response regulator RpaB
MMVCLQPKCMPASEMRVQRDARARIERPFEPRELRGIDAAILTRSVDIMISRLRQKLGDTVRPARFIQTVWGRGDSFIGIPLTDA